ncbi:MAG: hypothetical protein ACPG4X_14630 [Pikeienuella sp.]
MPPLKNTKHELAAVYRFSGHSQTDAYAMAGYSRNSAKASGLFKREDVRARIRELQVETARRVVERRAVTKESLTDEMDENRSAALDLGQPAAAQTATRDKAKMHGLMNEKSVHFHKSVDDMTAAELRALLGEDDGDGD